MRKYKVSNARKLINVMPTLVSEDATLEELALAITEDPKKRSLCVVDKEGKLKGLITLKDLVKVIFPHLMEIDTLGYSAYRVVATQKASDLLSGVTSPLRDEEDLEEALSRMLDEGVEEIPVIDEEERIIGELDLLELLSVWLEKLGFQEEKAGRGGVTLSELVQRDLIITELKSREKQGVIKEMIAPFPQAGVVESKEAFLEAIEKREEIESTAIGNGIAIPHGRSTGVKRMAIGIGRSNQGVDFEALDAQPVHLIFMIAAPPSARQEYLQTVAKVARLLKSKPWKEKLLKARTVDDLLQVIQEFDLKFRGEIRVKPKEGRVIHS